MRPLDPRLLQRTAATRPFLVGTAAVGSALALLVVVQAWLLAGAIGTVFDTRRAAAGLTAAPLVVGVFAARAGLSWLNSALAHRAAAAVKSQLRSDIITARLSQPQSSADAGTMITLMTTGLDALDGYYAKYLPQLVLAVTVPAIVGVAILSADWISTMIIALTVPLIPIFMILAGWLAASKAKQRWRIQARLGHHFADLVAGLPTLQVFGRARAQAEGLRRTGEAHRTETVATLRVSFLSALVLELLATLSVAIVAVAIGLRVVDGHLDLTTALFVLILAPEAYLPLRQVGAHYHDSADGLAAAEHAFALIDASPAPRTVGPMPDLGQSTIELTGVSVRYHGGEHDALAPLDLVIGPGELVAVTGPSGGGKSTLMAVLLGFVAPTAGQVSIGGQVGVPQLAGWLDQLAWVPQQPALLAGTIGSNVALGAPDAPIARVRAALDRAGGAELDLDQPITAGSTGLSAGELRRVASARALLRIDCGGGQLLIMDEPTAGLDADTELSAIDGVRRLGVTTLVVSHRPAVLAAADRLVELPAPALVVA